MSKKSEHKAAAASSSSLQNSNITLNLPASTNPTALKPELKTSNDNANNKTASRSKGVKSNEAATSHVVAKSDRKQFAHERWKFLKEAILNKNTTFLNSKVSVRRFDSFGFLKSVKIAYSNDVTNRAGTSMGGRSTPSTRRYDVDDDDDVQISRSGDGGSSSRVHNGNGKASSKGKETFQWYNISIPSAQPKESVKVRLSDGQVNLNSLTGFNNTGNVCIWPSEELMSVFCAKNYYIFDNKSVCELGGGMTCLAGLMISKLSQAKEVFLTDGNEASFEKNEFESSVECCLLQWNKNTNYGDLEERFDYIICADCLFFDECREDLCVTIYKLLKMDGTCLIFAPNRQNTFHKFIDMAKSHFECMIVNDYDDEAWDKHLYEKENNPNYDEDLHYPLLLKLKKRVRSTNDFCKMVF